MGNGLFTAGPFQPMQIIIEYTGETVTQKENEDHLQTKYGGLKNSYIMLEHGLIVQGTDRGLARSINYSYEPNYAMEKRLVHSQPRNALLAAEGGIMVGDELTFDGNFTIIIQICLCEAENCRGSLGKPPKERER